LSKELNLCISEVEQPRFDQEGNIDHYHACLFLIDETTTSKPKVIQQLHYNTCEGYGIEMIPNLRVGMDGRYNKKNGSNKTYDINDYEIFPIVGGKEHATLSMWNHMLGHAWGIKSFNKTHEDKIPLEKSTAPDSNNCRAGVKSSLASAGLELPDEYIIENTGEKSGIESSLILVTSIFNARAPSVQSLEEVYAENTKFLGLLVPPWVEEPSL